MTHINCKGKLISLDTPKVMGILNCTPDSFYDGGRYIKEKKVLIRVEQMLTEGATFIDVGGYSSRPNSIDITEKEEAERVLGLIKSIMKHFPQALLSIDTYRSDIARKSLDLGVAMVNDISSGNLDTKMIKVIATYQVPYIMVHMIGNPQNMMKHTKYEDLLLEVCTFFSEKINATKDAGINDVIIDPGFGFSKTLNQNYKLLEKLSMLKKSIEKPILIGVSRKSMIYKTLGITQEKALNGTNTLHTISILKGANILRVHDVKEAIETIELYKEIKKKVD